MSDSDGLPLLYLASTSPRRARLLDEAGYRFQQKPPHVDEAMLSAARIQPQYTAEALAMLKAHSVVGSVGDGIVIGADTLIVAGGRRLGKPEDADEAGQMLRLLCDQPHEVLTGVALVDPTQIHRRKLFADRALVRMQLPPDKAFDDYLDSGQWVGKAGGYNLAELDHDWHAEVTGDRTTVIGLPMQRLAVVLDKWAQKAGSASEQPQSP